LWSQQRLRAISLLLDVSLIFPSSDSPFPSSLLLGFSFRETDTSLFSSSPAHPILPTPRPSLPRSSSLLQPKLLVPHPFSLPPLLPSPIRSTSSRRSQTRSPRVAVEQASGWSWCQGWEGRDGDGCGGHGEVQEEDEEELGHFGSSGVERCIDIVWACCSTSGGGGFEKEGRSFPKHERDSLLIDCLSTEQTRSTLSISMETSSMIKKIT